MIAKGVRVNLTKKDAKKIVKMYMKGGITQLEIARLYGVSVSTIGQMINKNHWLTREYRNMVCQDCNAEYVQGGPAFAIYCKNCLKKRYGRGY